MAEKLNVHHYDGKWEDTDKYIKEIKSISIEIKKQAIASLRQRLVNFLNTDNIGVALYNFDIIARDNVYDPINKINVYDLMYILEGVCKHYEDCTDLLKLIVEQLIDMSTGLCPQGRTTRLYQLAVSFIDEEMI